MNNIRILPCENRKMDKKKKKSSVLIDSIAPLRTLYKTPGISSKSHKQVIKYSSANFVYDRVYTRKSSGQ